MNAIVVKNLTKKYGADIAVDNLSFQVKKGEVFGLIGANGAGKSSTIECILGTKKMDAGEVRILDMNPVKERTRVFERVGVQFQESKYQELVKVEELCEMTASVYREPQNYEVKKQGLSILLTSHYMDEIETLCDEILILKRGKTVFYGTVEEAKSESGKNNFEDAYLWYTDDEETNESI